MRWTAGYTKCSVVILRGKGGKPRSRWRSPDCCLLSWFPACGQGQPSRHLIVEGPEFTRSATLSTPSSPGWGWGLSVFHGPEREQSTLGAEESQGERNEVLEGAVISAAAVVLAAFARRLGSLISSECARITVTALRLPFLSSD